MRRKDVAIGLVKQWDPTAHVVRLSPLLGGISCEMLLLELDREAQPRELVVARFLNSDVLRRFPKAAEAEFKILSEVRAAGLPCPKPLLHTNESLLLEYLAGRPTAAPVDANSYVDQIADVLASIHSVPTDRFGFLPRIPNRFENSSRALNHDLREAEVKTKLDQLDPGGPLEPCLNHGDLWPGNLLWNEGRLVGILDWEEAVIGPAIADLAISRLDILWVLGREAMDRFTARYLSHRPIYVSSLDYWDLRAALRPMGGLAEWAPPYAALGRPDITPEHMRRVLLEFIDPHLQSPNSQRTIEQ